MQALEEEALAAELECNTELRNAYAETDRVNEAREVDRMKVETDNTHAKAIERTQLRKMEKERLMEIKKDNDILKTSEMTMNMAIETARKRCRAVPLSKEEERSLSMSRRKAKDERETHLRAESLVETTTKTDKEKELINAEGKAWFEKRWE
jgi:hypothetical protein